eukprot:gene9521-biopygen21242
MARATVREAERERAARGGGADEHHIVCYTMTAAMAPTPLSNACAEESECGECGRAPRSTVRQAGVDVADVSDEDDDNNQFAGLRAGRAPPAPAAVPAAARRPAVAATAAPTRATPGVPTTTVRTSPAAGSRCDPPAWPPDGVTVHALRTLGAAAVTACRRHATHEWARGAGSWCGIPIWSPGLVCRLGIPGSGLPPGVVSRSGLPVWCPWVTGHVRATPAPCPRHPSQI